MPETPQLPSDPSDVFNTLAEEFMAEVVQPWLASRVTTPEDPNLIQCVLLHPVLDYLAWALVQAVPHEELNAYAAAIVAAMRDAFEAFARRHYQDSLTPEPPEAP
jgi:hypothetical protein